MKLIHLFLNASVSKFDHLFDFLFLYSAELCLIHMAVRSETLTFHLNHVVIMKYLESMFYCYTLI